MAFILDLIATLRTDFLKWVSERVSSFFPLLNEALKPSNGKGCMAILPIQRLSMTLNDKRGTWPRLSSTMCYDLVNIMLRVMNIEFAGRCDQLRILDHRLQLARLVVNHNNR